MRIHFKAVALVMVLSATTAVVAPDFLVSRTVAQGLAAALSQQLDQALIGTDVQVRTQLAALLVANPDQRRLIAVEARSRAPLALRIAVNMVTGPYIGAPPQPVGSGFGPNPLFQNPLWWFGTPNPTPPPPVGGGGGAYVIGELVVQPQTESQFATLSSWYRSLDFEACVLGLSNVTSQISVGPYGTSTSSLLQRGAC